MNNCKHPCHYIEAVINSIDTGIVVLTVGGIIAHINEKARKILDLKNTPIESIDINRFLKDWHELNEKARTTRDHFVEHITIYNGKNRLDLEVSSIVHSSEYLGLLISIKDTDFTQDNANKYSSPEARYTFDTIIGQSPEMTAIIEQSKIVARSPSTVLITGSSGSGKELLAQAIHNESDRKSSPFITVNCGAIPKNLIESELFGYEDGAFTGAKKGGYAGKFELADGGTIFLDEIGEMPLAMQVTLLRALQEGYITRIGGKKQIPVNIRVIAATNKELRSEIKNGRFREDLFYRLNVIPIKVPALKDRIGDVPVLIDHFMTTKSRELERDIPYISTGLYQKMISYCWPGNVRELENCVENIVNLNGQTTYEINFDECTCMVKDNLGNPIPSQEAVAVQSKSFDLDTEEQVIPLAMVEKNAIKKALTICKGNISTTAAQLGISRNTLYNKMKKYGLSD